MHQDSSIHLSLKFCWESTTFSFAHVVQCHGCCYSMISSSILELSIAASELLANCTIALTVKCKYSSNLFSGTAVQLAQFLVLLFYAHS